jgi:hypothetical protein
MAFGGGGGACELNLNGNQSLTGCVRAKNFEVTIGRAACEMSSGI